MAALFCSCKIFDYNWISFIIGLLIYSDCYIWCAYISLKSDVIRRRRGRCSGRKVNPVYSRMAIPVLDAYTTNAEHTSRKKLKSQ